MNTTASITSLLRRRGPSQDVILIVTALVVGLGTGLVAIAFRYLIGGFEGLFFGRLPTASPGLGIAIIVLAPAFGGLVVGLIATRIAPEVRGSGVPEVMEAVALRGGRIRPGVGLAKGFASAICIGSGGSAGREGPIVQIGSSIGSSIGRGLRLSEDRVRNLVACGAAAGIAATFNAPIGGLIFALEVILGDFAARHLSTVVVSAVAAAVVGQAAFGDLPAFHIPYEYSVGSAYEYPLYVLLGVIAAFVGVALTRGLYRTADIFDAIGAVPEWARPAIGGALLGILALVANSVLGMPLAQIPSIFGVGYGSIESALAGTDALSIVMWLLVLKIVATSLTIGSGGSGGIFAPSLFVGAMLGSAFALIVNWIMPAAALDPGAYALVGMAAVFAAAAHAPLSAFMIMFELTGDYQIILALMLVVVVSTLLSRRLLDGDSIYTLKLSRRGVRLQSGRDVDVLGSVAVSEAMNAAPRTVRVGDTLSVLSEIMRSSRQAALPVIDAAGRLAGIVTASDMNRATEQGIPRSTPVEEVATTGDALLVAYPDESVGDVLARLGSRGIGRLPVVERADPGRLIGMIDRDDATRAYHLALTHRSHLHGRLERMQSRAVDSTELVDIVLRSGDHAVGRRVREVPHDGGPPWLLVSVQRADRTVIPSGDTEFYAGDVLTVFVTGSSESIRASLTRGDGKKRSK